MKIIDSILKYFGYTKIAKIEEKVKRSILDAISIDYISGEMSKITNIQSNFLQIINNEELRFFLKVISKFYRKNAVYDYLYEKGYIYRKEKVEACNIYLTGINKKTDKYLKSTKTPFNLLSIINDYKVGIIPKENELFIFDKRKIENFYPLCVVSEKKIIVIDGNHRICRITIENNSETIEVYLGSKL